MIQTLTEIYDILILRPESKLERRQLFGFPTYVRKNARIRAFSLLRS